MENDTNTGDRNTGDRNTGDRNTGNWNTGDRNTGDRNTGNWNTGDRNTGDWNTGDRNTGYCNTTDPDTVRLFNKEIKIERESLEFPSYFYHETTEWIYESDMTDKEKEDNPTYKTTGGYVKSYEYVEAWRIAWDKASNEDRRKTLTLPGWDNEVFKEISGIDVEKELKVNQQKEDCICKHCTDKDYVFCPFCGHKLN